ncbi:CoA transferase [Pigmentiphaga sp.]|uniref:CaiB/BaiF CoA transferase family protein n=1 Tax=Pigmentiphaga sp. TaxID=1977564 RepID=UPI0025CC6F11|nr:CoA transferase [Pigmentiphaga sp.]
MASTGIPLPLAGMKVLDATRVLAGPYCTYLLGLLGAEVVRVERPGGDTIRWRRRANSALGAAGLSTDYIAQACNKDVVYLDLAHAAGQAMFLDRLAGSDVLVENFRTGALARLGLDEARIRAARPGLVWCSITGYGGAGARAAYPAYDSVIQAASGMMNLTGDARSGPMKAGAPVIDYASGLNAALGVMAAWIGQRRHSRFEGTRVEVSMLDSALALMHSTVAGHLNGTESLEGRGNAASSGNPLSRCYDAADGRVCIAVNEPHQRRALLAALGLAALSGLDDHALSGHVQAAIRQRSVPDLDASLNTAGAPCAPVQGLDRAVAAACAADPGFVRSPPGAPAMRIVGLPFRLDGSRGALTQAPGAPAPRESPPASA